MKKDLKTWRKLDNSAKIFPMSTGEKYSTVFRISVLLKEDVNKNLLEKAVKTALKKYEVFKVKMKAGGVKSPATSTLKFLLQCPVLKNVFVKLIVPGRL